MTNTNNSIFKEEIDTAVNSTDSFPAAKGSGGVSGDLELRAHHFCSIEFTDGSGNPVTPGAGTFSISVKTQVNPNVIEAVPSAGGVDATANQVTFSVAAPVTEWEVTTSAVTTATHYILRTTSHRS